MTNSGDSCHPMLPYLAQGANSSLEDGAVLGGLLSKMTRKSALPDILRLYENLRKKRGEAIARETFKQVRLETTEYGNIVNKWTIQRHDFHMPDGPEQRARDEIFASQRRGESITSFPSRW
jgi:salicylate hydroxylase